jgi:methylated-DNA-protein-cysteine methyltransferase-like protein
MSERVVTEGFHQRVFDTVRAVPEGRVTTYGDVAAHLGSPRVARHVGWALAALPEDTDVPWHRVINAQGRISYRGDTPRAEVQMRRLAIEGVPFDATGRCDLHALRWRYGVPAEAPER